MNDRLKSLYKTVIVKHNNEPVQFEKKDSAQFVLKANSAVCGDRFTLFFDIENEVIKNLSFYGHGCAISKASTSIMVQNIIGKTIVEALEICNTFYAHIQPEEDAQGSKNEIFEAFSAVEFFPERKQCATLSWDEVALFLKNQSQKT